MIDILFILTLWIVILTAFTIKDICGGAGVDTR